MKNMEAKVYNQKGKEAGTITLPEYVFGLKWNADLVHQVVIGMMSNARQGTADTKGRGEVAGGGRKPWKQKGTGRARHGSNRSPIWKGGGVTHGPLAEKNYDKKINKKMKAKALYTVLSEKLRKNEIIFVDSLDIKDAKTKDAVTALKALSSISGFDTLTTKKRNAAYVTFAKDGESIVRSMNNIPAIDIENVENINPVELLKHKYLVMVNPNESIAFIGAKLPAKTK